MSEACRHGLPFRPIYQARCLHSSQLGRNPIARRIQLRIFSSLRFIPAPLSMPNRRSTPVAEVVVAAAVAAREEEERAGVRAGVEKAAPVAVEPEELAARLVKAAPPGAVLRALELASRLRIQI